MLDFRIKSQEGFIALVSTIVISILLITITVIIGMNNFFVRFNILDTESKERSLALAEGCLDKALFNLSQSPSYSPSNEIISIGADSCTIVSIENNTPSAGESTIKTQAVFNKSYSNLKIFIDSAELKITAWKECPNLNASC